jgi:hypothetical protein
MPYSHGEHREQCHNDGQTDAARDNGYHQPYQAAGWGIRSNKDSHDLNNAYHEQSCSETTTVGRSRG